MDKVKKHLTSVVVFGINLILVGIGFLFIKNNEEAKNNSNNIAGENVNGETENKSALENVSEAPVAEEQANIIQEKVAPDAKNIASSTMPVVPSPATTNASSVNTTTTNNSSKSSAKTKTS